MDISSFDTRKYPIMSVKEGYAEWVKNYERTVQDEMDIRLLNRIKTITWRKVQRAIDLACGTGRIGSWLRVQGVVQIDGVDFTPEMLEEAKKKSIYWSLHLSDISDTGLQEKGYDLTIEVLADEHLKSLEPLYREAARLTRTSGYFVIVGYHPHFLMEGNITHFHREDGEPIAIESYVHLLSDHVKAAHKTGWLLREMDEGLIDEDWVRKKPKWKSYRNRPVSFLMVWEKCI